VARGASAWVAGACAVAVAGGLVLLSRDTGVAAGYFLASRVAYVLFVGIALRAQDTREAWTRRWGNEGGYRMFRGVASLFMANDALSIVLVCVVTRGTLSHAVPLWIVDLAGAILVVLGVTVKGWAVATLGRESFFWRSFFAPPGESGYSAEGPYRHLVNPMYSVGYAHAYGLALLLSSLHGLGASLLAHASILVFYAWVERPHNRRLRAAAGQEAAALPDDGRR